MAPYLVLLVRIWTTRPDAWPTFSKPLEWVETIRLRFAEQILVNIVRSWRQKLLAKTGKFEPLFLVYVDANKACNDLSFILGQTGYEATLASRSWSIRVTQFDCGYENLAPAGCTQYFYGSDKGTVKSYNWEGNYHLADQNQVACIRREKGNCRMCYSTELSNDIQVSGEFRKVIKRRHARHMWQIIPNIARARFTQQNIALYG